MHNTGYTEIPSVMIKDKKSLLIKLNGLENKTRLRCLLLISRDVSSLNG